MVTKNKNRNLTQDGHWREWIGCFGLTEPNHGSDPGDMDTRAKSVMGGIFYAAVKCGLLTPYCRCFYCLG